jgi:hypothetical protein
MPLQKSLIKNITTQTILIVSIMKPSLLLVLALLSAAVARPVHAGIPFLSQAATFSMNRSHKQPFLLNERLHLVLLADYASKAPYTAGFPSADGRAVGPSKIDGRAVVEFVFSYHNRIFYWQPYTLTSQERMQTVSAFRLFNPRVGYQLFDILGSSGSGSASNDPLQTVSAGAWILNAELYFVPGWVNENPKEDRRQLSFGIRTVGSHEIANSSWSFGLANEVNYLAYFKQVLDVQPHRVSGALSSWVSYGIMDRLHTIHSFVVAYQLQTRRFGLSSQDQPFISNGLKVEPFNNVMITAAVNNYTTRIPSLRNTWFSLGVNVNLL